MPTYATEDLQRWALNHWGIERSGSSGFGEVYKITPQSTDRGGMDSDSAMCAASAPALAREVLQLRAAAKEPVVSLSPSADIDVAVLRDALNFLRDRYTVDHAPYDGPAWHLMARLHSSLHAARPTS